MTFDECLTKFKHFKVLENEICNSCTFKHSEGLLRTLIAKVCYALVPATCSKQKTAAIKAGTSLSSHIVATEAGQDVNVDEMLEYEMSPVPCNYRRQDEKVKQS